MKKQEKIFIEYTTIRIKTDLLYKLVELRGKHRMKSSDEVIEYLINKELK
jgi:hypothetical protein